MTELAHALSVSLLRFVWEGAIAGVVAAAMLGLLRNRSANARYVTACFGLAVMAAMPVVETVANLRQADGGASVASALPAAGRAISTAVAMAAPWEGVQAWVLRVWAAGVFLFGLRLALSYGHVARLRRMGESAGSELLARASEVASRMGVLRPVTVLVTRVADCPSVTGWLRPAILMPAAVLAGLDAEQLEAILAHELAHIRRHDYLVNLLQTVIETLLFYHPAVWWLSARIRRERECCCDDLAARHCGDAMGYARALTSLERLRVAPVLTPAANGSSLLFRVRRLMGVRETAPSRWPALAAVAVAAACLMANTHWAHGQTRDTASVLSRAPLEYPEAARAKGIEGTVVAEVTLDAGGGVSDARILTGPVELRKAALASVLDWRFAHSAAGEVRQVPIEFHKGMDSVESAPGRLVLGDELNSERLAQLAEERSQLEGALQRLQRDNANAQAGAGQAGGQGERAAQLRAEIEMLQAQLSREQVRFGDQQFLFSPQEERGQDEVRLLELQAKLAEMSRTYAPDHPQRRALENDVAALQSRLAAMQQNRSGKVELRDMSGLRLGNVQVGTLSPRPSRNEVEVSVDQAPSDFPAHSGDIWSDELQTKIMAWVRAKGSSPSLDFHYNPDGTIDVVTYMMPRH